MKEMTFFLSVLLLISPCKARHLGCDGAVFEIQEESMLSFIQRRLQQTQKSGKLKEIEDSFKKRVRNSVMHPKSYGTLPRAEVNRVSYYDPSVVVEKDIKDTEGQVIHRKGKRVNPLDFVSWGEPLIFLNGDDLEQVVWALGQPGKKVLVACSPIELYRTHGERFYFDQGGAYSRKFDLRSLPVCVTQEEGKLKIHEVKI